MSISFSPVLNHDLCHLSCEGLEAVAIGFGDAVRDRHFGDGLTSELCLTIQSVWLNWERSILSRGCRSQLASSIG